jgi:beta-glucanase (GH16 family)
VRITTVTRATPYGTSFYEVGVWGDASSYSAAAPEKGEGQGVGQLLSYGKPVEAANAEGGHVGSHVVDGDLSTRWSTDPGQTWQVRDTWDGTAWLAIDLGATPDAINQISMRWNPAYAASYSLHVADGATLPAVDDPAWREIYATTAGSGKRDTVNLPDPSITGRWVLIKMLREGPAGDGNFYGYSLFEVRVYGDAGPQFPINTPPANPNDDATNPDFNNLVTVWEDTFDGAAGTLPDPSRWTIDPAPAGQNNAELQSYTSSTDNIALDGDGNLVITAIKNSDGSYTSGRLNTSRKAHVQYGRVEARAKIPAGQGLWPAFWLMGENFLDGTEWPTNGEIDVMEVLGHDTETLHNTIHGPGYSGMGGVGGAFDATVDLSQDFHTYGFDWDRDGLRFWLDSPEQITRTIPISRVEDELGFPWVYDQPFFMILNLAVGGDWPGSPNANTEFPAQLIVDHVRVQQSEGSGQLRTEDFTADPRVVDIAVDAPTTLVYGERPTLNITATSGRTTTPSGDLTVAIGEESDVIRLNRGAASYRLPTLPVGEHTITLSYADPSGGLYDATRTFTVTVQAADSALLVDLGGETVAEIEPVVAVVRFAAAPGVFPTGKVRVEVDGDVSGEVTLVPEDNGVAVLRLPARTTVGSRTVTVSYEGDANNAAQTVELTHSSRELPPCPAVPGDSSGTDSGAESGADSGGDTTTDGTSSGIGSGTGDGVLGDQVATGSNSTDSKEATSGDSTQSGGLAKAGFGQPYLAVLAAAIIGGGYLLVRQTRRVPLPTS